ncbi:phenylalanine--tRNA ligase, mitochondrial-like [Acropora muricata]|uniref:phenylalanine--tRNA ligase, mitochondrial-like n=1 Tax=Acropora muricata TaxID=159855 RepID=UPI0034E4A14B
MSLSGRTRKLSIIFNKHVQRGLVVAACLHNNTNVQSDHLHVLGKAYLRDDMTNITPNILSKLGRNLHLGKNHPLSILRTKIQDHVYADYRTRWGGPMFTMVDYLSPVVTVEQNFDSLLVPKDHVSRAKNENYYLNSEYLLRAHTSAHQRDLIKTGLDAFLVTGDVYRRDEIDMCHYPVFHQMEGVRLFSQHELFAQYEEPMEIFDKSKTKTPEKQAVYTLEAMKLVEFNLKQMLVRIVEHLCGEGVGMRWVDAYFPFTHPSWELEVQFEGEWLELLGCGVMEHNILVNGGAEHKIGWAFGIGLERLAMKLFNIPDIRLFWSEDPRFLSQFEANTISEFKPFSKYPPTYKDVAFWVPEDFSPNNLFDVVRGSAGDIVEKVELKDKFTHPKTQQESHCYRITYRSMDKTFTDAEINSIQDKVRKEVQETLQVELR